ncbi:hypothetical protein [Streptomyces sp. NBC_01614]|uniref:Uncharacterized protein n=1 Tax=Streptomyces sp. NBC_00180 TaxID=2903632 RepID=A0AAU1IC74_9ACTN
MEIRRATECGPTLSAYTISAMHSASPNDVPNQHDMLQNINPGKYRLPFWNFLQDMSGKNFKSEEIEADLNWAPDAMDPDKERPPPSQATREAAEDYIRHHRWILAKISEVADMRRELLLAEKRLSAFTQFRESSRQQAFDGAAVLAITRAAGDADHDTLIAQAKATEISIKYADSKIAEMSRMIMWYRTELGETCTSETGQEIYRLADQALSRQL